MKKFKVLVFLVFVLFQGSAFATDYYVCDTGSDSNSGVIKSQPYKTFSKGAAAFNSMNGGDSVLFCKGGTFDNSNRFDLYNSRCSPSARCTLGAYGTGNKPKFITNSNPRAGLHFSDNGDPDSSKGYTVKDIHLLSDGTTNFGVQFINDVDDVTLENLRIEGFGIGVYSAGSNAVVKSTVNGINDNLILRNSVIINNHGQGWLGGGDNVLIENNVFENNGFGRAVFNHNIYLSGKEKNPSSNIVVRGNTLYKSAFINGSCRGVSLVGHGLISNLLIENNVIKEPKGTAGFGCWGIAIDPGYASEEAFYGLIIRNNTVENLGGLAIGCASCVDVIIEGNTITDAVGTLREGISIPNRAENTLKSDRVLINNNTILLNGRADATGVRVKGSHSYTVTSNIIDLPSGSTVPCVSVSAANAGIDTLSNICTKSGSVVVPPTEEGETEEGETEEGETEEGETEEGETEEGETEEGETEEGETEGEEILSEEWGYSTTKAQLEGLILQLQNLIKNGNNTEENECGDTAAALRSIADIFGKQAEVQKELSNIKEILKVTK